MLFRRILFWSHLSVGLVTGLILFVLALTGVALTYESQIKDLFGPTVAPTVEHAEMLSTDELVALAATAFPGKETTLSYSSDSSDPIRVQSGRRNLKLMDPYQGIFIKAGKTPVDSFFSLMEGLHRNLAMGFDSIGADLVKISNVAFLFIILSGMYLWLPKRFRWPFFRQRILITKMPTAKARDFNWHHVFSFWVFIPLLAVVISGATLSYPWARNAVFAVAGVEAPQGRGGHGGRQATIVTEDSSLPVDQLVSYQTIYEKALSVDSDWRSITLTLPASARAKDVTVVIDTGNGRQAGSQQMISYSRETGEVVKALGPDEMISPTNALQRYLRFLHTGEIYGVVGQTLAGIASLACLFLVWTGFALAWRRLVSPLFRPKAKPTVKPTAS